MYTNKDMEKLIIHVFFVDKNSRGDQMPKN